jgi:hypothetical protein
MLYNLRVILYFKSSSYKHVIFNSKWIHKCNHTKEQFAKWKEYSKMVVLFISIATGKV